MHLLYIHSNKNNNAPVIYLQYKEEEKYETGGSVWPRTGEQFMTTLWLQISEQT